MARGGHDSLGHRLGYAVVTGGAWRWSTIAWIAACVGLATAGQLFMKVGMTELDVAPWAGSVSEMLRRTEGWRSIAWALAGVGCYGLALLAYLSVLARIPLSVAYPLLSLSYALVALGAAWWPRVAEPLSIARIAGIAVIIAGVALVVRSRSSNSGH